MMTNNSVSIFGVFFFILGLSYLKRVLRQDKSLFNKRHLFYAFMFGGFGSAPHLLIVFDIVDKSTLMIALIEIIYVITFIPVSMYLIFRKYYYENKS